MLYVNESVIRVASIQSSGICKYLGLYMRIYRGQRQCWHSKSFSRYVCCVAVAQVEVTFVHRLEQTGLLAVVMSHGAVKGFLDAGLQANLMLDGWNDCPCGS